MANKSNQHYVPQFYFKYFSNDKKSICVLNRKDGMLIKSASIKGQASKKYFYGDEHIEDSLSKVEGHFSSVLRTLKMQSTFEKISNNDYIHLLQNICLQRSRTLSARNNRKEYNDLITKLSMEVQINNDDSLSEETKEEYRAELENIEANPKFYQGVEMDAAMKSAQYLMDLQPLFLSNGTNRPFVFGDAPVIFTNPHQKNITWQGVLGMKTPGIIIYYPIGCRQAILLIDAGVYKVKKYKTGVLKLKNLKDIENLNKLQIHNASNAVYFSEFKLSNYVGELWRQEKNKLTEQRGRVAEIKEYEINGDERSDLLHNYESQLPLIPKLSFLEYEILDRLEYKFSRDPRDA